MSLRRLDRLGMVALACGLFLCFLDIRAQPPHPRGKKPRVIATTDGEIDDQCSMIRFLMYTNEWDVEGIIFSSSIYHWKGDAHHKPHRWNDESWLYRQIDAYAKVYPNLKANDPGYPSPEYLRSRVFEGNVAYPGDMEKPTPGSNRIVQVLLESDPTPVWLLAWGGANTIARALKTIEEDHPDRIAEVSRKVRMFLIAVQDNTLDTYLRKRWRDASLILSTAFGAIAYQWQKIMPPEVRSVFDAQWMRKHILNDHGPLCALYPALPDGRFRSEGDSPSFMHLIDVGLGNLDHPSYGGWGGRFERRGQEPYWKSALDDGDPHRTILRWAVDFQNDWAARADWCVKPFAECNHRPKAVYNGDDKTRVLYVKADPGDELKLSALGSSDPDGNQLSYKWWVYKDAGTYWSGAPIRNADCEQATLRVPQDASGRTIHVILQVTDDGQPPLTAYRRIVVEVSGEPQPSPWERYLRTPITRLSGPPDETGPWTFYRGININGPPVEIDGRRWEGDSAPNVICKDRPLVSSQVALRPPTDPARAAMIHAFRWSTHANVTLTAVPNGTYAVYVYVWEDNNPERLTFSVNGRVVLRGHISGTAGEWHRLGPWIIRVTDGVIRVTGEGGAANISGIEVWKRTR